MTPAFNLEEYSSAGGLASAAAAKIAAALRAGLRARGEASFAGSGGSTPGPIYRALAAEGLDWAQVQVTLADEREVPPTHKASNEGLLREHLFTGAAAVAKFVPLQAVAETLRFPLDAAVFGMGTDGHTLSWFPGAAGLEAALSGPELVVRITPSQLPPEAPFPRWSLTRAAVAGTRCAVLAITGTRKREVLEAALSPGSSEELAPVRALVSALGERLTVAWSP